jgi:hypothetical protein
MAKENFPEKKEENVDPTVNEKNKNKKIKKWI